MARRRNMTLPAVQKTTVDAQGRIVIPAEFRSQLGLRAGTPVSLEIVDGVLHVMTSEAVWRQLRETAARYAVPGESAVDALFAERRWEFAKDEAELAESLLRTFERKPAK